MSSVRGTVAAADTITIDVPIVFRKRGGRKTVVTPDGSPWAPRPRVDNAMVKALARAFRWQRMLDDGVCGTIEELAQRERVGSGYVSRVLRLTLLAPDMVEVICRIGASPRKEQRSIPCYGKGSSRSGEERAVGSDTRSRLPGAAARKPTGRCSSRREARAGRPALPRQPHVRMNMYIAQARNGRFEIVRNLGVIDPNERIRSEGLRPMAAV